MKKFFSFLLFTSMFIPCQVSAQEIEAKLGGVSVNDGFSVIDPNSNTLLRVRGDGNVGIGTTNPESKLEISSNGTGLTIKTSHSADYGYNLLSQVDKEWTKAFGVQYNGNENITMYGNGSLSLLGNVGIGTLVPSDSKLAVNGVIKSKEVLVTIENWPDFVFSDDYEFLPLSELEKVLDKNNHLPGIPSKDEVETNGISLGEMQSKLLQKIEELTLYLIEQDKRIAELEETIISLKNNQ